MSKLRKFVAIILGSLAACAHATDLTDLWLAPSEAGWGVNVVHQADILFLTFFIYGADQRPWWLSGSSTKYQSTNAAGHVIYSGPLAQTTGPWFGAAPFDPNAVIQTAVGTVTFTSTSVTTATLTYNVGGTTVTKQLTRYAFRANDALNGSYFGGVVGDLTNCTPASSNGHFEGETLVAISGAPSNAQVKLQATTSSCTMTGPYSQSGRMGRVQGTITCTTGASGTVDVFEIEANSSGVTARYQVAYTNGCRETGHFGGVRR